MKEHLLPNGKRTTSEARYHREWNLYGKAVCRALSKATGEKIRVGGYNPDLLLYIESYQSNFGTVSQGCLQRALAFYGGWKP